MQTRMGLLHAWTRQVQDLLPTIHATRAATLALFAAGVLWAGQVTLLRVAVAVPLAVSDASIERRLRRFLANPRVAVAALWEPLLPVLLGSLGKPELLFVFDPTPYRACGTVLCLGVVWRGRILPVAWRVMPQQTPWPQRLGPVLDDLLAPVAAALPPGCQATLLADRGLVGPALLDAAQRVGWHVVLRVRASAGDTTRVRLGLGADQRLVEVLTGPGQRLVSPAAIFKDAGWRRGFLTIHWPATAPEPWVLFSDRPGGAARVREYRQRTHAEATYADVKGRGFNLERSKVTAPERVERLLLVLHLALWWAFALGAQVIRRGQRRRFDRADRRELSLIRLGRTAALDALSQDGLHALLFRLTPTGWVYPWP